MNKHPLTIDSYVANVRESDPAADESFIRGYMEKLISGEYKLFARNKDFRVLDGDRCVCWFEKREFYGFCRDVVEYQRLSNAESVEQIIDLLELRGCSSEGNCRATLLAAVEFGYEGRGTVIAAKESNEYFNFTQVQADALRKFIERARYKARVANGTTFNPALGGATREEHPQIEAGPAPTFNPAQVWGRAKREEESLVAFAARVSRPADANNLVSFLRACIDDEEAPCQKNLIITRNPSNDWWHFDNEKLCAEAFAIVERERWIKRGVEVHAFVEAHARATTPNVQKIERAIEEPGAGSQALVRTHAELAEAWALEESEIKLSDLLRARAIVRAVTRKCDSAGAVDTAAILDDKLVALTRALSRSGSARSSDGGAKTGEARSSDVTARTDDGGAKTGAARSSDGEARVMRVVFEKDSPIPVSALPEIKDAIADDVLSFLPFDSIPVPRELGEVLVAYANWEQHLRTFTTDSTVSLVESAEQEVLRSDLGIEE